MILAVAVDDRGGLLFNKRRQSQDVKLREHLLLQSQGSKLWMNSYSYKQFAGMPDTEGIRVEEAFLSMAEPGDYCFVETDSVQPYAEKIEKILLYKWNRSYPSDVKFDFAMEENGFHGSIAEEFVGNSHEKITLELWEK